MKIAVAVIVAIWLQHAIRVCVALRRLRNGGKTAVTVLPFNNLGIGAFPSVAVTVTISRPGE